jgi:hypothetical protein
MLQNHGSIDRVRWHSRSALFIFVAIYCFSGLCMAESLEYCYSHPLSNAEWSDNALLPKFDTGLGELIGAKIRMIYNPVYDLNVSNNGNHAANITLNMSGNLLLTLPDRTVLVLASGGNKAWQLNPKDKVAINESDRKSQVFVLNTLEYLAGSSSGENIILPIDATVSCLMSSNQSLVTNADIKANASICIIYEYAPFEQVVINGSGTENPVRA